MTAKMRKDEMLVKTVQLNLFELVNGKCGVFKIFPLAAHREGNLKIWIELAGGVVLKMHEEDPCMIPIVDIEWYINADVEVPGIDQLPSDHFHPSFIYDCYEWERVFDLNGYRIGKSRFVQYDANRILKRSMSWSELLLISPVTTPIKDVSFSTRTILRSINTENTPENVGISFTNQSGVDKIDSINSNKLGGGNYVSPWDQDLGDVNVETDHGFEARVEIENDDELVLNGARDADDENGESDDEVLQSPNVGRKLQVSPKKTKYMPKSKHVAKGAGKPLSTGVSKHSKRTTAKKKTDGCSLQSDLESAIPNRNENEIGRQPEETATSDTSAGELLDENTRRNTPISLRRNSALTSSNKEDTETKLNKRNKPTLAKTVSSDVNSVTNFAEKNEHDVSLKRRNSTLVARNPSEKDNEIELVDSKKKSRVIGGSLNEHSKVVNDLPINSDGEPDIKKSKKAPKSKGKNKASKVDQAVQVQVADTNVQRQSHPFILLEHVTIPSVSNANPAKSISIPISGTENVISSKKRKRNKRNEQEAISGDVPSTDSDQCSVKCNTKTEDTSESEVANNMLEAATNVAPIDSVNLDQVLNESKIRKSRRKADKIAQEVLAETPKPMQSSPKRFPCKHCTFIALKHFDLLVHLRIHTGEEILHSKTCDISTPVKSSLTRHGKKKH